MIPVIIKRMFRKKIAILIILVLTVPVAVLAGMFALLQSPRAINTVAAAIKPLTGISLQVDDISLNHQLAVSVSGFRLRAVKENGFDILLAKADVNASVGPGWQVEVDKILLTGPKFTFHMKNEKTDPFAVLKKLPPVHLLVVKNGHLELKSDSTRYSIPGMEITIGTLSPKAVGS